MAAGRSLFCIQDATIAACCAQLAATAQGLASCWVGYFDEAGVATALRAPAGFRPVAIMPIGYAAAAPDRTQRRKLDELVRYGVW
jgi:nitroreductase